MDIKKLADVKDRFADYEKIFNSGDYDKAADILSAILERIEECTDCLLYTSDAADEL